MTRTTRTDSGQVVTWTELRLPLATTNQPTEHRPQEKGNDK